MSTQRRRILKRALRIASYTIVVATVVAIVAAASLLLQPVRDRALSFALGKARASLPGSVVVRSARWSEPGRVEFDDVLWTDENDTLAVVERFALSVSLRPLVSHRLVVRECSVLGLQADAPAIAMRFPPADSATVITEREAGGRFLRPGSLPGVPAIAVERLEISAPRLRLSVDGTIESIDVLGAVDLLDGRPPSIAVERLHLKDAAGRFAVDNAQIHVDLDAGILTGHGTGHVAPGRAVSFVLRSAQKDSVDLHVVLADSVQASAGNVALDMAARLVRQQFEVGSVDFQATLHVPARDSLPAFFQRQAEKLPSFGALDIAFDGRYERHDDGSSGLRVRVDERPPFGGLDARLTFRDGRVAVDTLSTRVKDLVVAGSGARSADGHADARFDARGVINGFVLTDFRCRVDAPALASPPYNLDVSVLAADMRLSARAVVERPDEWMIKLQPLVLTELGAPSRPLSQKPAGHPGEVRVATSGAVLVRRLTIAGGAGRYVLDGSMSRERRGEFRLDCHWNAPPAILLARLVPDAKKRAEIAAAWPEVVRGMITATTDLSSDNRDVRATLTLSSPGWIDSSLTHVHVNGANVRIDSTIVAMPGLGLRASGEIRDGEWNAKADVAWDAGSVAERLVPAIVGLTGEAHVSLTGSPGIPRVRASLRAAYESGGTRVPAIVASGYWLPDRLSFRLSCPNGTTSGHFVLDSLTTTFDSRQREPLPAYVTVNASGRDLTFAQHFSVSHQGDWVLDTDSLRVALRGQRLRATHPFRVLWHPERSRVTFEDVELSGSLGTVRATGVAQPDSSNVNVHIDIELPPKPASLTLPEELWPGRVALSLAASGRHHVVGSLIVSDFALGGHTGIGARMNATAAGDSVTGDLAVSSAGSNLVSGTFQFPGAVDVFPPRARLGDGALSVLLDLQDFPIPDRRGPILSDDARREVARLGGKVWIGGTGARPAAGAEVTVSFPAASPLANIRVDLDAYLSAFTLPGDVPQSVRRGNLSRFLTQLDPAHEVGFVAVARMLERGKPVADGVARLPLDWSLSPPVALLRNDRAILLRCSSGRLPLAELAPLMPEDVGLEGTLEFDLAAEGLVKDAALSGQITGRQLTFTHANGTHVSGQGKLRLEGTSTSPSIEGEIQIVNGVITVPETTRNLHPAEGESILWRTMTAESSDSAAVAEPADTAASRTTLLRLNLDISLVIPSALWIRGKGLDVELAGNLTLAQRGAAPTVAGELNAVRGQLLFLGRTFNVSRGTALFYGEDTINPSLDLELTTTVEGTVITVRMLGTAEEPEITLSSEPSMSEGDIMSFLVFGKRMEELNSDQVGLVQQRASETVATFGTQLASRLSRQMGVDLITLSRGQATGQSTLTIGKYVTHRALLKYEQSLEERATFLIDLEYFLTRTLRLETFIGQQQQSGLEVNWTRDY